MSHNRILMLGNEAIARGALEGGVAYCTGYPGNPSSEIIETLFNYRKDHDILVEWSVNEIVALEAAAAVSFTGLRSLVAMKQNGLNVCADFLTTVCLNEIKGGLVLVVCDDPGPLTSSNEQDSRHYAKIAQVPLLEPSSPAEAKEMTRWLLRFSEEMHIPCLLRSVARLSHGRGVVSMGDVSLVKKAPAFDTTTPLVGLPFLVTQNHRRLLDRMQAIRAIFNQSAFNRYEGPQRSDCLIIASGLGAVQAREAVDTLGLGDRVGILKIGTTWPLPAELIQKHLQHTTSVLFVEEVDPFIEDSVKVLYAENHAELQDLRFYGKNSADIAGPHGPGVGEMNSDIVMDALCRIFDLDTTAEAPAIDVPEAAADLLKPRELAFCSGCPHRASFFAITSALALDGRNGFVVGDIGCYGLAAGATGFNQIKALHCMGSGMGNVSGFGRLNRWGFDQPAVAVVGDSTFYHAGIPALVNALSNGVDALFIVLDNAVTAMTGFQPNPASPMTADGNEKPALHIEDLTLALGIETTVVDPVQHVDQAVDTVCQALQKPGVKTIVFRRMCATYEAKAIKTELPAKPRVDAEKCIGEACGCNRLCSRVLSCPAVQFDESTRKAFIQEEACNGCGLCAQLCPQGAIG